MTDPQRDQQPGTDDQETPKPKTSDQPVETEESGAGYGNHAGPQDEVDER